MSVFCIVLLYYYCDHIEALLFSAVTVRYEMANADSEALVHKSETALVIRALDHRAREVYAAKFDAWLQLVRAVAHTPRASRKLAGGTAARARTESIAASSSMYDELTVEQAIDCLCALGLYPDVSEAHRRERMREEMERFNRSGKNKSSSDSGFGREAFVDFCCLMLGESMRVVIKFMKDEVSE